MWKPVTYKIQRMHMRIRLIPLLLLFTLLAATRAKAQEKVFRFGPKAGINLSDISGLDNVQARIGFHAGLLFNFRLAAHWRLQPEAYFSTQGGKGPDKIMQTAEQYNYLALPVLAQYRFTPRLFAEAGPQLGILVNPRRREYMGADGSTYYNRHEKTADFLVAAGAGYEFNNRFGINLRYTQGITSIRTSARENRQVNMLLQAGGFMYLR